MSFLQHLLSTFPHDDQQMGGGSSGYGGRQRYGAKNSHHAQEITIESLIGQILKKVDLHQHVIAQAAAYMNIVKAIKSSEAQNIAGSGPRGQSSSSGRNSQSRIDSSASKIQENEGPATIGTTNQIQPGQLTFKNNILHDDYIRVFMNFVEFIVINSRSITLQFQHVQEMFKIFVTEAVTEVETREFFDFLTKQNQNARSRERLHLLDEKLRF